MPKKYTQYFSKAGGPFQSFRGIRSHNSLFQEKKRFSLVESQHKKGHMKHMKHYLGATYSIKRGHRRLKVKKVLLFFLLCKKPTAHHIKSSLCACVHIVSALTHLCRMTPDTRRTAAIAD